MNKLQLTEAVAAKEFDFGILVCGTGIGIGIAANKVPGIRAALCSDTFSAHATRQHNNANILTMGQRVVGPGLAIDIVKTFLNAKFQGDRHQKRIDKITAIEEKYYKQFAAMEKMLASMQSQTNYLSSYLVRLVFLILFRQF